MGSHAALPGGILNKNWPEVQEKKALNQPGIAWYCVTLYGVVWYCVTLHDIVLHGVTLYGNGAVLQRRKRPSTNQGVPVLQ